MAFPIKIGPQRRTAMDLGGETSGREAPTRSEAQSGSEEPAAAAILRPAAAGGTATREHSEKKRKRDTPTSAADVATQTVVGLIGGPKLFNIDVADAPAYISLREAVFFTRKKRKPAEHGPTDH